MNPQKFTQKSLEAIQDAQNIAIQNQNIQIEQEHLLYALVDQEGGLTGQLLVKIYNRQDAPGIRSRQGAR
jgi:ATP-dependent Clp protease ATP-binding subunit ClpB